jgi:cytochrome P450
MNAKKIPRAKGGLPFLGHIRGYLNDRLSLLEKFRDELGDIYRIKIGPKDIIVISDSEMVKHVMLSNFKNYKKVTNLSLVFGDGILTANGSSWKDQRSLMQPLFSKKYFKQNIPSIIDIAQRGVEEFALGKSKTKDLGDLFTQITFDIMMKTIMGIEGKGDHHFFNDAFLVLTDYLANDNYRLLPNIFGESEKDRVFKLTLKKIDDFLFEQIEKAKKENKEACFINILLNASQKMDMDPNEQRIFVRDNTLTLMLAGYETTASSLAWFTYNIEKDPEWTERCYEESQQLNLDQTTLEDLAKLINLNACINESLRLFPPGWAFKRTAVADDQIKGFSIQAGDTVLVSPYLTHRYGKIWDQAHVFRPDRFFNQQKNIGKFDYFPFGAGPRTCVGMQLGLLEIQLVLAVILKKYRFVLQGDKPLLDARATLLSTNGHQYGLEEYRKC